MEIKPIKVGIYDYRQVSLVFNESSFTVIVEILSEANVKQLESGVG